MSNQKDKEIPRLELIKTESELLLGDRRKLPRLALATEQFRLAPEGKLYSVCDLSDEGMGLGVLDRSDLSYFTIGLLLKGVLNIKRQKYSIQARVKHLGRDRIGCAFVDLPLKIKSELRSFLSPTELGAQLKPIPAQERNTLWYHGPSRTDLFLKRSPDGHYKAVNVYVLGIFAEWDAESGLCTGSTKVLDQESENLGIVRLDTLSLNADSKPDPEKLSIAKSMILHSHLPQDLRSWCLRHFD